MKKFYLFATAVTMLTACTNSEKLTADFSNDGPVMIGFETFHEKATRATGEITAPKDLNLENKGFGVWGFKAVDAAEAAAPNEGDAAVVNVSGTSYTNIFNNDKVWWEAEVSYDHDDNPATGEKKHQHFKYLVPKYWDKGMEYIFFAYAPYNASKASLDKTTGNIKIEDIPSIQDISVSSGEGAALVYSGTTGKTVTDYLMAKYETNQKLKATNQVDDKYNDKDQTVGFTFGHMLSKLQINLKASDTDNDETADEFSGIKEMKVTYLSIKNMPEKAADETEFTQTSPTAPAGTYSPSSYTTELQVINSDETSNLNATATSEIYILKEGDAKDADNNSTYDHTKIATLVDPTFQNQSFNYYVAPNTPTEDTETDIIEGKYLLSINYTIVYVDGITENVTISDVDLSEKLAAMLQNNAYTLTIKVGLNQIFFTVDAVTDWVTENNSQEIEIK